MEGEIQGVALNETFTHGLHYIEILLEGSVGIFRAAESKAGIEHVPVIQGPGCIFLLRLLVPCDARRIPDGPVVVGIFEGVAGCGSDVVVRNVAEFHIVAKTTVPRLPGGGDHSLQGTLLVDIQALRDGIGKHRYGVISAHTPVLVGHMAPDRKHPEYVLVVVGEHRFYHIPVAVRLEESQERMLCAVSVPQAEHRVVGEPFCLVDLVVEASVGSVHVHIDRRVDHRMVKGRVEHFLLGFGTLDFHLGEFLLPGGQGFATDLFERLAFSFGFQVLQGSGRSGGGKGNLYGQFRVPGGVELEPGHQLASGHRREVAGLVELAPSSLVVHLLPVDVAIFNDRLRERDGEVSIIGTGPSVGDAVAGDKPVVLYLDFGPQGFAVIVIDRVDQVKDDLALGLPVGAGSDGSVMPGLSRSVMPGLSRSVMPGLSGHPGGEGIMMDSHPLCGSEPGLDAVVFQGYLIIASLGLLAVVGEAAAETAVRIAGGARIQLQRAGGRHYEDISEIGVSRTAEMGVAESDDGRIRVTVPGTGLIYHRLVFAVDIVRDRVRVRTELDSTERDASPGKGMSHSVGADEWIHI